MELGACPSKGAELRPHVDDDLGGRRAEILQPAPYACLEKFSRPTELLGSQGLAAKHDTSAGHPKVSRKRGKPRSKAPALVFPNASSQPSCPKSVSPHVCAGAEKGWLEGRQHSSGCRDLGSLTPQVSSD